MNAKKWIALVLFALAFIANLVGSFMEMTQIIYITKPLLMPLVLLNALFELEGHDVPKFLKPFLVMALLLHCAGDVFLMLPDSFVLFASGLACFLVGHIFYISIFIRKGVFLGVGAPTIILIVVATLAMMLSLVLMFKFEGVIKYPVFVYGSMLLFLSMCGFAGVFNLRKGVYWYAGLGALLFLFSDFMVAWRSLLGHSFTGMGFFIMLTYVAAECLIVTSIVRSSR